MFAFFSYICAIKRNQIVNDMDWISDNAWIVWAITAVLCVILELMSGGLVLLCFAVGAAAAALVSPVAGITSQLIVFVIATLVALAVVKYYLAHKRADDETPAGKPSNAEALIGRKGKADSDIIRGDYGWVAIDGDVWKAKLTDDAEGDIAKGEMVEVIKMESIILTVRKINN